MSVIQLLLGGILPGLLCVAMLMLMTGWLAVRRNYPRAERWPTVRGAVARLEAGAAGDRWRR